MSVRKYIGASRVCVIVLAAATAWCAAPHAAYAGVTLADNYDSATLRTFSGSKIHPCRGWGGDADDAGRLYAVCFLSRDTNGDGRGDTIAPALVEYDDDGVVNQVGWMPSDYYFGAGAPGNYVALDVAVAPDGTTAYVTPGPNIDNLGKHPELQPFTSKPLADGVRSGSILRLRRGADGTWDYDPSFHAGPFLLGDNYWAARRVDVDASGRLYVTSNAYVFELDPETGNIVSHFGDAVTDGFRGPYVSGIDVPQGIAVSRDGSSILVVEQRHNLVLRYTRTGETGWEQDMSFQLGTIITPPRDDEPEPDYCSLNTHFQSPYDVAIDIAGDIYVMDTTCNRVQRYTSTGTFVQTVWRRPMAEADDLSHGFGVNPDGSVLLPTEALVLRRLDPAKEPPGGSNSCVDTKAPTLAKLDVPSQATKRSIDISVDARDDCTVRASWRVTGERSGSPTWTDARTARIALTGWNGSKQLTIEVRDAAGHSVTRAVTIVLALPQPTLVARSTVTLGGRGCSSIDPRRRIANAGSYRIIDRCAQLTGRVTKLLQRDGGAAIEIEVPVTTARQIYTNAVGAVRIWFVTDARSAVGGRRRVGARAIITSTLVTDRSRHAAYGIPVDRITLR